MTPTPSPSPLPARQPWRVEALALAASLFFALACNLSFWPALLQGFDLSRPASWGFALACGVALVALQGAMLMLVLNRWTARPLLALLLLATAFAVHYMRRYNVYLDPTMLRNVLRTDVKEASELLGWGLLPTLLLYAVLPIAVVWRIEVRRTPLLRAFVERVVALVLCVAVTAAAIWSVFPALSSRMREHKELRYLVTPGNYIVSLLSELKSSTKAAARPRQPIGTDAKQGLAWPRPALLVLVIGETVRAANWGLDGYARQTTPELAAWPGLVNFPEVTSCGTNTETSLPCMFSPWGRRHYDESRIVGSQSLMHVLQHAGVPVLWRDNQSGCKGVCEGLPQQVIHPHEDAALCDGDRCLDEVLLKGLDARLAAPGAGPQVLVLHMLGNHGPAYFKRYPPAFRRFVPACEDADLRNCSREQIVNAYDNAVLYTDHVLADLLRLLKAHEQQVDAAVLYVSDHGESLGENNLYLHGIPYAIAPNEQTRVPMVMWVGEGFARDRGLDLACLRARAAKPASHDNLFHTVLGLLDVRTSLHENAMDLTSGCIPAAPPAAQ